ncbi:MAG TPA: saposin domain-containing protein, partial [Capillimicrobium sp.]
EMLVGQVHAADEHGPISAREHLDRMAYTCKLVPEQWAQLCSDMVQHHGEEIIRLAQMNLDATTVCVVRLGFRDDER